MRKTIELKAEHATIKITIDVLKNQSLAKDEAQTLLAALTDSALKSIKDAPFTSVRQ